MALYESQPVAVTVVAEPLQSNGLQPGTWLRARLEEVSRVTGRHSTGYAFRFACDAGEVWGTVWEPVHAARPIHHWLEVLSGHPPVIGEEIELPPLVGARVDVYCEEETEADPSTGRPALTVVDLRRAKEDD